MIFLATTYREGGPVRQRVATTQEAAANALPRLREGEILRIDRLSKYEAGFLAGLIAADHPQLWSDEDLCANINRQFDNDVERR